MPSGQYRRRGERATPEQYRARAAHVEEILAYLGRETPRYADWELGMAFYATKHTVCMHILLRGDRVPRSHRKMEAYLRRRMRKIYPDYKKLYGLSIAARYRVDMAITPKMLARAKALRRRIEAALP